MLRVGRMEVQWRAFLTSALDGWNQAVSLMPRALYPQKKNVGLSCHGTGDWRALETSEHGGGEKFSMSSGK